MLQSRGCLATRHQEIVCCSDFHQEIKEGSLGHPGYCGLWRHAIITFGPLYSMPQTYIFTLPKNSNHRRVFPVTKAASRDCSIPAIAAAPGPLPFLGEMKFPLSFIAGSNDSSRFGIWISQLALCCLALFHPHHHVRCYWCQIPLWCATSPPLNPQDPNFWTYTLMKDCLQRIMLTVHCNIGLP